MDNNSIYSTIKPLFKFLPYLGSFLCLLGMVDQVYYYYAFGIHIVTYLDLSEVLVFIVEKLTQIIATLLFCFSAFVLFRFLIKSFKIFKDDGEDGFLPAWFKFLFYTILVGGLVLTSLIRPLNSSQTASVIIYFVILVAIYYAFIYEKIFLKGFPPHAGIILFIISFSFIWTLYSARDRSFEAVSPKASYVNFIVLDSSTIRCDSTLYFIGKTKEYLFLYNEKNHNTIVYPMSRVKEMDFVNNRRDRK